VRRGIFLIQRERMPAPVLFVSEELGERASKGRLADQWWRGDHAKSTFVTHQNCFTIRHDVLRSFTVLRDFLVKPMSLKRFDKDL
jgi:hypothetical protein